jgi:hypothetical protein
MSSDVAGLAIFSGHERLVLMGWIAAEATIPAVRVFDLDLDLDLADGFIEEEEAEDAEVWLEACDSPSPCANALVGSPDCCLHAARAVLPLPCAGLDAPAAGAER